MPRGGEGTQQKNAGKEQTKLHKEKLQKAPTISLLEDDDDRSFSFPLLAPSDFSSENLSVSNEIKENNLMAQKEHRNLKNQNANENGTLETFYKESDEWEIYRQKDDSGKYLKFRLVDKKSDQTKGQWIMPNPKKKITLFFNNSKSVKFHFDQTGKMEENDKNVKDKRHSEGKALFDQMVICELNEYEVGQLIANSAPPAPIFAEANAIPSKYPSENIYEWHKMPLPVHPEKLKLGRVFIVDETDIEGSKKGKALFDRITERMDDGKNWVQIEVRQGEGRAKFVRNLFGGLPNVREPMPLTLFFDGAKRHFDWNGSALSNTAFHFWRKSEQGKAAQTKAEERAMGKDKQLQNDFDNEWMQNFYFLLF
ncbi:hypothetical protein niasHT_010120 [Heterodera trifolii]|uniref:Uncharacterized protein n=1 Tax=Heterodera trifolii TaxID=157864 RepID=A0ABD2LWG5_9BILA